MSAKSLPVLASCLLTATLALNHSKAYGQDVIDGPLPAPWTYADIGSVGVAGSATHSYSFGDGDTFTVRAAGADVWGAADSLGYVYAPFVNDGWIATAILSLQNTSTFAKAGLMLRESLDPGAEEVIFDVRPTGDLEFMKRSSSGAQTTFITSAFQNTPVFLQLFRDGPTVTAYVFDPASQTNVAVASTEVSMRPNIFAGLAVTSHDQTARTTAVTRPPLIHNYTTTAYPDQFWHDSDIGNVGLAGHSSYEDGTFTVYGAGADIWGTADSFHMLSTTLNGSEMSARVNHIDNTNPFAKAGIDMRLGRGPTPNDSHVIIDVRPTGDVEFMARSLYGQETTYLAGVAQNAPVWLKLTISDGNQSGSMISGYVSADGANWTLVGSAVPDWANMNAGDGWVTGGLVVCSHDTSTLAAATFDDVGVFQSGSALPQPWSYHHDVGDTGQPGSASWVAGVFTVNGAGRDIWGAADSFYYVYQQASCECPGNASGEYPETHLQVTAHVTSLQNTNPFAKAGVMLRSEVGNPFYGAAPSTADVILDVRPTGDVEFMSRNQDGGETTYIAGTHVDGSVWLRLLRSDDVVIAFVSNDGASWSVVGSTTTGVSSDAVLAGLAVTSHDPNQLTTATFDHVEVVIPQ